MNVGVAAHITAAAPGGARYDGNLTPEARSGTDNGIWLCQKCAHLVDVDTTHYTVTLLRSWKGLAEETARIEIETGTSAASGTLAARFARLEMLMPELLAEMRDDLRDTPTAREFVVLWQGQHVNGRGTTLVYYHDTHPELDNLIQILGNEGFVTDITTNNVPRFVIAEPLADYLAPLT